MVDVIYDPADISELSIEYQGHQPFRAKEMVIGEQSAKRPKLPEHMQKVQVGEYIPSTYGQHMASMGRWRWRCGHYGLAVTVS